jgi:HEPN domain-containing protein
MGLPHIPEARVYYRAAKQRYEDAQLLLAGARRTGAVYLAGYTVECFMKAILLASVAGVLRKHLLGEFRGNRAHNIEWLGDLYRRHVGITIPAKIAQHLSRVASWSTDMRYATGILSQREADEFFESVHIISAWVEGRL